MKMWHYKCEYNTMTSDDNDFDDDSAMIRTT
jgi:hypothetical protein